MRISADTQKRYDMLFITEKNSIHGDWYITFNKQDKQLYVNFMAVQMRINGFFHVEYCGVYIPTFVWDFIKNNRAEILKLKN